MNKKIPIKKLYTGLGDEQVREKNKINFVCSIITVVAAIALACLPMQSGIRALYEKHGFVVYSVALILWLANVVVAVFCLASHFGKYKICKELYETDKTALKGDWHTFAGLEIQLVLSFVSLLAELYLVVRAFDVWTFLACVLAAGQTVAAFFVRKTTSGAYKNLSETAPETDKNDSSGNKGDGADVGAEKADKTEKEKDNDAANDFYDRD